MFYYYYYLVCCVCVDISHLLVPMSACILLPSTRTNTEPKASTAPSDAVMGITIAGSRSTTEHPLATTALIATTTAKHEKYEALPTIHTVSIV